MKTLQEIADEDVGRQLENPMGALGTLAAISRLLHYATSTQGSQLDFRKWAWLAVEYQNRLDSWWNGWTLPPSRRIRTLDEAFDLTLRKRKGGRPSDKSRPGPSGEAMQSLVHREVRALTHEWRETENPDGTKTRAFVRKRPTNKMNHKIAVERTAKRFGLSVRTVERWSSQTERRLAR